MTHFVLMIVISGKSGMITFMQISFHRNKYRISSVIRRVFFSFQNNPKVLDPSCKTDLELWHCLGRAELVL